MIGSSNTDLVIKTARIPDPGETVLGGTFLMTAGGKGANQAVAVARLGGDVTFMAKVGSDMFGDGAIEGYRRDRMDTSFIIRDMAAPSGVALIVVDQKGENSIVVAPGANNMLNKNDILAFRSEIEQADYLLMQLEIPMEVIEYAAEIASNAGVKVILNPAPAADLSDDLLGKLYLITPNRSEASRLTGIAIDSEQSAATAADALLARGVSNVVITLGKDGSLIRNASTALMAPARKVEAQDTTAAGDTFNGGLVVALSEGRSLVEAVKFATSAAAISVTRMGAQASIPCRNELEECSTSKK
ncbi:ribokinase [Bacteroidia bacterium]|nr:ribokinase [Bacteroidia bacterium]